MEYRHDHIVMNGRYVSVADVIAGAAAFSSPAEEAGGDFIRRWLTGEERFTFLSSGTTGPPKTITFNRHQIRTSALNSVRVLSLRPDDTALVCLHPRYVAGRMMLARAMVNQMKIILIDPVSNPLEKIAADAAIDFAAFVPAQLQNMLEAGMAEKLNTISCILIGGANPGEQLRAMMRQQLTTAVYVSYGMTETLTHVALENPRTSPGNFRMMPGCRFHLDERSCLIITTPFTDEPVVTHDVAEAMGDDSFRLLGRYDQVINTGGVKVHPETIERKIEGIFESLNIKEPFIVAGVPDDKWGAVVTLIIGGAPFPAGQMQTLKNRMATVLDKSEKPRRVIFVPRLVYTFTGKIARDLTLKNAIAASNPDNQKGNP